MTPPLHEEDVLGKPLDVALLRRLLTYLKPHLVSTVLAVLMLIASAALQVAGPYLTKDAIDRAIPAHDFHRLGVLAALFTVALLLEFALEYGQTIVTARIGQRVMIDLRLAIFGKLQRLGIAFYDGNPVGRLMTRVTSDVETLNELFTSGVVSLFGDLFALAAIMLWMLWMDARLALAAFAVIPFMVIAAQVFRVRVRAAFREIRVRLARINAFLQEHLSGMRIVQLFGREERTGQRHEEINRAHLESHLVSITVYATFFPVLEVLMSVALAALILYGGGQVLGHAVTVGVLAAFLQLTRRFFQPLQDIADKFNIVQSAMASSERVFGLLDEEEAVRDPERPVRLPSPPRGEVAFEDVWFRYPSRDPRGEDEGWVLKGVSFTAHPGERIALVGHTGAGKTTVTNLLLRFHDVDHGRITLDGIDIRDVAQDELRARIGLVQQDIFLFTGDLRSNIRLDQPIDDNAVEAAAERVGAHRFIARLPARYDHLLGERGQSLSVGERQLLAFARALAVRPAVLVLDEATSSVDAESEELIQTAIVELMRGRTCLIVAHRLSTVQDADTILVLHHGQIRERGTHRDLLARAGLYEKLYHLQLGATLSPTT